MNKKIRKIKPIMKVNKRKVKADKEIQEGIAKRRQEKNNEMQKMCISRLRNTYLTELVNSRYWLTRCNMIAEQLNKNNIKESIDGCKKSQEYCIAEYGVIKLRYVIHARDAHFAKKELIEKYNFTAVEFSKINEDYFNGKFILESEDLQELPKQKAEFVANDDEKPREKESKVSYIQ